MPPPRNVIKEVYRQLTWTGKYIGVFLAIDMPVISFPGFIVIPQYTLAIDHKSQSIFEHMRAAKDGFRHMPNDHVSETIFTHSNAPTNQLFGLHGPQ
jgi:hypothetical protein